MMFTTPPQRRRHKRASSVLNDSNAVNSSQRNRVQVTKRMPHPLELENPEPMVHRQRQGSELTPNPLQFDGV